MKPLFTVHAGEYLVGGHIERKFPRFNVWVPSRDTGIDLLVSDRDNRKAVSLQVKFSKDFNPSHAAPIIQDHMLASGWWTHNHRKIAKSEADFWVLVLPSFFEKKTSFIILPTSVLLQRLRAIHGRREKKFNSYLGVTKTGRCWETRGLGKADKECVARDRFSNRYRDFTRYLNNWEQIENRLR